MSYNNVNYSGIKLLLATELFSTSFGILEIQYFNKSFKNWVLNPNDKDSRLLDEMEKVHARVDNELNYIFDISKKKEMLLYIIS